MNPRKGRSKQNKKSGKKKANFATKRAGKEETLAPESATSAPDTSSDSQEREVDSPTIPPSLIVTDKGIGYYLQKYGPNCFSWEQFDMDWNIKDALVGVRKATEENDTDTIIRLLLRLLHEMMRQELRPDERSRVLAEGQMTLLFVSRTQPHLFCNEILRGAILALLKLEPKTRFNEKMYIMSTNLLTRAYNEVTEWPEILMQSYIDDAVNERLWVDNWLCGAFVINIRDAFNTKLPDAELVERNPNLKFGGFWKDFIKPRFTQAVVCKLVNHTIRVQMKKVVVQKNFLRFLCTASGFEDVRYQCIKHLHKWLRNQQLTDAAKELLAFICSNIDPNNPKDEEVLSIMVKMRLKGQSMADHYIACFKHMLVSNSDILEAVMELVVVNEVTNPGSPYNLTLLVAMFEALPEKAVSVLGDVYQDLMVRVDIVFGRAITLFKQLVRALDYEINLSQFCQILLDTRCEVQRKIFQIRKRMPIFIFTMDIVCVALYLAVTPMVRDAEFVKDPDGPKPDEILDRLYSQVWLIQLYALEWLHMAVPSVYILGTKKYNHALRRVLLVVSHEEFLCGKIEENPEEKDNLVALFCTPVAEDVMLAAIAITTSPMCPNSPEDFYDIMLESMLRVSQVSATGVYVTNFNTLEKILKASQYIHPPEMPLLSNYQPPMMAYVLMYWKALLIVVLVSAHNPTNAGVYCWKNYPIVQLMMEMCITKQFDNSLVNDEASANEEKNEIRQYEQALCTPVFSHLIINDSIAYLHTELVLYNPSGPRRKIPQWVLQTLTSLNSSFKLGEKFAKCEEITELRADAMSLEPLTIS